MDQYLRYYLVVPTVTNKEKHKTLKAPVATKRGFWLRTIITIKSRLIWTFALYQLLL